MSTIHKLKMITAHGIIINSTLKYSKTRNNILPSPSPFILALYILIAILRINDIIMIVFDINILIFVDL
jgi:hypothetical protein